jgi:hypothetical protein
MIHTTSVPSDCTIVDYLRLATKWDAAKANLGDRFEPDLQIPGLAFKPCTLADELSDLLISLGPILWRSKTDLTVYGLSLSYNPDHPRECWPSGSFGHERYRACRPYDYYKAVEHDTQHRVKGDYLDSYGFRCLLPEIAHYPALKKILSGFSVPLVRTTIRVLNGLICRPNAHGDSGMHRDDSPFEVLRINLCVTNNGSFGYQYRGLSPRYPMPGNHWVVNSDHDHRVAVSKKSNFQRIHLVIGLAPWFDYDASADAWLPNQWFGNKHPYDMAREGLLFKHTENTCL